MGRRGRHGRLAWRRMSAWAPDARGGPVCSHVAHAPTPAAPAAPTRFQAQAQRGVKQAAITQPEPDDPVGHKYGDPPMVQSTEQTGRKWTRVEDLKPSMEGQTVRAQAAGWRGHRG
jgi:hypothetical protein